jgi:hypothetical protein
MKRIIETLIEPQALLNDGIAIHESVLRNMDRHQLIDLMWGLSAEAESTIDEDKTATVCLDFASYVVDTTNIDIALAFCRSLVGKGRQQAHMLNAKMADMAARAKQRSGDTRKSFVERIAERRELQQALASSWSD